MKTTVGQMRSWLKDLPDDVAFVLIGPEGRTLAISEAWPDLPRFVIQFEEE